MIGSYSKSSCIRTVFISKHVTDHKFLEDDHEDSLQIPRQKNRFMCNLSNESLTASRWPAVSRSFRVEDTRTSEQHRPDARSSFSNFFMELDFSSQQCLGSFCKTSGRRGNTFGRCPAFQNILVFRSNAERRYSEDSPDARSSHLDVYLLWKDLCYSGRRSQKTIPTRLTYVRTLDSQSSNLSRFRFSVSL
jgi:hypothetical protein